jgi:ribosome recycling factor
MITTPEPRLVVVQPFDAGTTKDIEKALKESKLGINPITDGKLIRLPIPPLTEDRRRDLVKAVKQMSEEAKIRVRSARRDAMDSIKKAGKEGGLPEDAVENCEKEVQKLTDTFVRKIEETTQLKEADIMKV